MNIHEKIMSKTDLTLANKQQAWRLYEMKQANMNTISSVLARALDMPQENDICNWFHSMITKRPKLKGNYVCSQGEL
jgi:hypothetical protein